MAPVDWVDAWKNGRTPWDAGESAPALHDLLDRGLVPGGRILVPGCGTGYDLWTLSRNDREVVGIDLSEEARDAFLRADVKTTGSVEYLVGDFFSFAPEEPFDFVWDYTFFCALDPDQRAPWGSAMKRLLKPGATLATLLFPFEDPISDREGPPWPINTELVRGALGSSFEALEVREAAQTHPGREGQERLALWRRS